MLVERRALFNMLKELGRVVPNKAIQPILEQVLLTATNGTLTATTTDLQQRLTCQLPAEGEITTCLSCKTLVKVLKPEGRSDMGMVELHQEDQQVALHVDGLTTRLPATDPAEFPAGPVPPEGKTWGLVAMWPAILLKQALEFVLPAASKDMSRPHLCTLLFQDQDIVATDGHRMHLAPLPAPTPNNLLVPATAAATLIRILLAGQQTIVARAGDVMRVRCGPWQFDTRLSDSTFPPYWNVIPKPDRMPTHLELQTQVLKKALDRVSRLSRDKKLKVRVNGALTLTTWNAEDGAAEIEVCSATIRNPH